MSLAVAASRPSGASRRHELDWIRVLAIGSLLIYHSALIFSAGGWVVSNRERSLLIGEVCYFFTQFRMPLMFFASGVSTAIVLGRWTAGRFVSQRLRRLLIPLLFGVLVLIPPQLYVQVGAASGPSFLAFYPRFLETMVPPTGVINWEHLWYLVDLLLIDTMLLPVLLVLRTDAGAALRRWAAAIVAHPAGMVLPALAFVATGFIKDEWTAGTLLTRAVNVKHFAGMAVAYLLGYVLAEAPAVWDAFARRRRALLAAAVGASVVLFALRWSRHWAGAATPALEHLGWNWTGVNCWFWIIACVGYARQHLRFENRFLRYGREASYPVYLLHHTVIVLVGAVIVQWEASIAAKLWTVIAVSTTIVMVSYEYVIRRTSPTRVVFGLPALRRPAAVRPMVEAPVAVPRFADRPGVLPIPVADGGPTAWPAPAVAAATAAPPDRGRSPSADRGSSVP